jgi:transcriptional regulator with XRE-family HTH domain
MTTAEQDTDQVAARPASGVTIVPEQLTNLRDACGLSRAKLAEKTGEILFDYGRFAEVLTGRVKPDAQTARAMWVALDCQPGDLFRGLPPDLPRSGAPLWFRSHDNWSLDTDAVARLMHERSVITDDGELRSWNYADLATATARHWFSRDAVNKNEAGNRRVKPETLQAYCQILGCEPRDMMAGARPVPDGATQAHRETLDQNRALREWADAQDPPVSYRTPGNRISYAGARKKYEAWLAEQAERAAATGSWPPGWDRARQEAATQAWQRREGESLAS